LAPIQNQTIEAGRTLSFTVAAAHPTLPRDQLIFSLAPGAPAGATIDPATGAFAWIPSVEQNQASFTITVRVALKNAPGLSAAQTFTIKVSAPVAAPLLTGISAAPDGSVYLVWNSEPGVAYQVRYKSDLTVADWTNLGTPLAATNATTSYTDERGGNTQRYYQILRVEGR
jgi:hypothetical protein